VAVSGQAACDIARRAERELKGPFPILINPGTPAAARIIAYAMQEVWDLTVEILPEDVLEQLPRPARSKMH
jgi:hypothetical protein